ncbi:hypothetical protein HYW40_03270 [Candidatus Curtissbacteria bacterium]|nr:hypothetical protein [Candidatus Curtissbacteria bacterium]
MSKKRGKLIVFEGADGTGKTTQAKLLLSHLRKKKIPSVYISFPRYERPWGKMVRRYLLGDFGKVGGVDPYLASILYAGDRAQAAHEMRGWISQGKIIVCNRYVGSNIGHMAAKIKNQKSLVSQRKAKIKYIEWLEDLEYRENGIPKEDLVILLQVDPIVSRRMMKDRKLDIHEKDLEYLQEVCRVYDYVAEHKKNWVQVNCTKGGEILGVEEIHQKVLEILKRRNIL